MKCPVLTVIFCVFFASSQSLPQGVTKYRHDYEYNSKTKAFYKLHVEESSHEYAQKYCEMEGATLMVPDSKEDLVQAHAMLKKFPDLKNNLWIGSDAKKHESAEEHPIIDLNSQEANEYEDDAKYDIMTRHNLIETVTSNIQRPFICKVEAKEAPYDDLCGVYAFRYQYYSSVGSCYKIPLVAVSWNQAFAECQAEGAHLVVLNSEEEHQAVWDIIRAAPRAPEAQAFFFFFAGIRADRPIDGSPRVFRTVSNETLEEAGYSAWSEGEPNNYQDTEYCGTVFLNNGKYNDVECSHKYQFICESEVRKKSVKV